MQQLLRSTEARHSTHKQQIASQSTETRCIAISWSCFCNASHQTTEQAHTAEEPSPQHHCACSCRHHSCPPHTACMLRSVDPHSGRSLLPVPDCSRFPARQHTAGTGAHTAACTAQRWPCPFLCHIQQHIGPRFDPDRIVGHLTCTAGTSKRLMVLKSPAHELRNACGPHTHARLLHTTGFRTVKKSAMQQEGTKPSLPLPSCPHNNCCRCKSYSSSSVRPIQTAAGAESCQLLLWFSCSQPVTLFARSAAKKNEFCGSCTRARMPVCTHHVCELHRTIICIHTNISPSHTYNARPAPQQQHIERCDTATAGSAHACSKCCYDPCTVLRLQPQQGMHSRTSFTWLP